MVISFVRDFIEISEIRLFCLGLVNLQNEVQILDLIVDHDSSMLLIRLDWTVLSSKAESPRYLISDMFSSDPSSVLPSHVPSPYGGQRQKARPPLQDIEMLWRRDVFPDA